MYSAYKKKKKMGHFVLGKDNRSATHDPEI